MACVYDDAFAGADGSAPNSNFWNETDTSNLCDIQSNKLNFADSGATDHFSEIKSKFTLHGDFDIQIDFDVTTLNSVGLYANYAPRFGLNGMDFGWCYIGRIRSRITNGYFVDSYEGDVLGWDDEVAKADASGKLRVTRSGSTIKAYYWNSSLSRWEWDGNTAGHTMAWVTSPDQPVKINIYFKKVSGSSVNANVDNLVINSGCPGILFQRWTNQAIAAYSDPQPSGMIDDTEEFASDTGQFTRYTEDTQGTFTVSGGVGQVIHNSGAARNDLVVRTDSEPEAPQIFASVDINPISTSTGYDNGGVGIIKDQSNFVLCMVDRVAGDIRLQVKIGGSSSWCVDISGQAAWLSSSFKLGLSLIDNSACIWKDSGAGWTYMGGANIGAYYDFRTVGNLSGWRVGFAYATKRNGQWNFDNLTYGRFGGVGMRDITLVTQYTGSPYTVGNYVYFTATCPDPRGISSCNLFRMDMSDYSYEQIGTIMVNRDSKIWDDLNGHIVRMPDGTFHLLMVTWANEMGNSIRVLYKNVTSGDLLSGLNVILSMTELNLPGMDTADYGSYDAMLVYNSTKSRWEICYSIVNDTDFTGTNWAAAAYSADLTTWTAIDEDDSSYGNDCEGTKYLKYDGAYYILSGGPADLDVTIYGSRVFDEDMVLLGRLNIEMPSNSPASHPMVFQFSNRLYLITFDDTELGGGFWTRGQPQLYYIVTGEGTPWLEATRGGIPSIGALGPLGALSQ